MTEAEKVQAELEQALLFQRLWDAPMSKRGFLIVRATEVKLRGLDHGTAVIRRMDTVPSLGTILTIHEAGSTHWTGRGMARGYSGAATFTVLIAPLEGATQSTHILNFRYVRLTDHTEVKTSADDRAFGHGHYLARLQEES